MANGFVLVCKDANYYFCDWVSLGDLSNKLALSNSNKNIDLINQYFISQSDYWNLIGSVVLCWATGFVIRQLINQVQYRR